MEGLKRFFSSLPLPVWIVSALVIIIIFWWVSDDIGSWWEGRQRTKFDSAIAEQQIKIDSLAKERDDLLQRAVLAETREQGKILEADLLRQEAAKRGVNIQAAQDKIDGAIKEYSENLEIIEKVKTGEISKLELCQFQCQESAAQGYPCRVNYCAKFKE